MKNKIAIITNGGGMKCSYSAGVLCAMAREYNFYNPDILVGSSGSAGSLAYYLAGQYDSIQNIWTDLLTNPKFISFKRIFKIMDIDYLIDTVFKQLEPLNIKKIKESNTKLFISVTELQTWNSKFTTNTDDIFECLKASKAIPVITNKKVSINNIDCIDGSISSPFNVNINKAISEGADNIIIIKDTKGPTLLTKIFFYIVSLFFNKNLKKALRTFCKSNFHQITPVQNKNIIIISPSKKLKIHVLNNKKQNLENSFFLGYKDLKNNIEFKKYFQKYIEKNKI